MRPVGWSSRFSAWRARVPRGHEALLPERGRELGQTLERGALEAVVVLLDLLRFLARQRDRHDLLAQNAGIDGAASLGDAPEREFVLLLAGDLVPARQVVRSLRHVAAAVRIAEGDHQGILERALAQPDAAPRAADHERRLAQVLDPAREHEVGLAQLDHLRRGNHGLDAAPAQAVHRERRHRDGHASLQRHVPRAVQGVSARLERVPHHHVIDDVGGDIRALERRLGGDRTQVDRGNVLELPARLSVSSPAAHPFGHRGSRPVQDHYFVTRHRTDSLSLFRVLVEAAAGLPAHVPRQHHPL